MVLESYSIPRDCSRCEKFTGDFTDCRAICTHVINPGYKISTKEDLKKLLKTPHF